MERPVRIYSNDVDYEFRQDSNLYYLTGIDQPNTILVLMPGNRERKRDSVHLALGSGTRALDRAPVDEAGGHGQSGIGTVTTDG